MAGDFCSKCRGYGDIGSHRCPPIWEVAMDHGDGDPYWQEVYAWSEEVAAEKYADSYDCEGDYTIITAGDGGETKLLVRKCGENTFRRYHVIGESVPSYHATLVE